MSTQRLMRIREGISHVLAWFAGLLLVAMAGLVLVQVFTRYVLGSPAAFTEELVRDALIWTSFISAAYAFAHRKHMSLVFVRDRFPRLAKRGLLVAADAIVLLFALLVLVVGGTMLAIDSSNNLSALLGISRGAVYAIVPIAGIAISFVQALHVWEDLSPEWDSISEENGPETDGLD